MRMVWKYFFLGMLLGGLIMGGWVAVSAKQESMVLSANTEVISPLSITSTPTSTPIPTLTPTLVPTPKNTPTPTPTPAPTPVPANSQEINEFIERFAKEYRVNPNELRHIAICESGFNPKAVNGPYLGLFQFTASTWANNRALMGKDTDPALRLNAEESVATAAYLLATKGVQFWPNCQPKR